MAKETDTPKDEGLQGNEKIEEAILELQKEPTPELLAHVLTVIRRRMKEGGQAILSVEPPSGDDQIRIGTVKSAHIQELETLVRLQLPVKIFIWNNQGYASIRSMQNNNFGGFQVASGESSGLSMPDTVKVAEAYGLKTFRIADNRQLEQQIENVLNEEGPVLCELMISPDEAVSPRTKTIIHEDGTMESYPLEKMWP